MMRTKIIVIGEHPVINFAADELFKYLKKVNSQDSIIVMKCLNDEELDVEGIYVGMNKSYEKLLPTVEDPKLDDGIFIDVRNGKGIITGTNERSVLLGVYRYLKEIGVRFIRPGESGEIIPSYSGEGQYPDVRICEAASYRHRTVCIEGAVSYENVIDTIDFLPKIGMNGFFSQFNIPGTFYNRWYGHEGNLVLQGEKLTNEEISAIVKKNVHEIKKRGLVYQSMGHGWTCLPFGIEGTGWESHKEEIPDDIKQYFAMVDGERGLYNGVALATQLCFSNKDAREIMLSYFIKYCQDNPEIDYMHFWIGDAPNNHCECENCVRTVSDYYVDMLNELDARLTELGIKTKIVFLIYFDLLWPPIEERIKNIDRFVLMFAPITRTYSHSLSMDKDLSKVSIPPYVKNQNTLPKSVEENLAHLYSWQKIFSGDSFDFDYHYMWDHFFDPGYTANVKVLYEDIRNLRDLGLNGLNSCQNLRVYFPNSLGMIVMGETLWNRDIDFEDMVVSHLTDAFGEDGIKVKQYFEDLSELFDPEYIRGDKALISKENEEMLSRIPSLVANFTPTINKNLGHPNMTIRNSWVNLLYHGQYCILLSNALKYASRGDLEGWVDSLSKVSEYMSNIEMQIQGVFDLCIFHKAYARITQRLMDLKQGSTETIQ
jgi:hypothetical protein